MPVLDVPSSEATNDGNALLYETPVPPPGELRRQIPRTTRGAEVATEGRAATRRILRGEENRFLVVVGPCSIHDTDAAREYATRLVQLKEELDDRLCIVMRAYFEKPRTTIGWRGLINDPYMDGSYDMPEGIRRARQLLVEITDLGLPVATELLDTATPAYFADLISFGAIGARTTESQPHRAMASGLDMPIGFKNGTNGGIQIALDAMLSSRSSHSYLGFDQEGRCCMARTLGNPDHVLILRGGNKHTPNYDIRSVMVASEQMRMAGLNPAILVDASHANSGYEPQRQPQVCRHVLRLRASGQPTIKGVMIESNLFGGKQSLVADPTQLRYGVSVTDACLAWEETEGILREMHASLA
jgi:3-deoxy-7-phosphoheptulonate synthase